MHYPLSSSRPIVQRAQMPARQAGFASLDGVVFGTTVALIALWIVLAGHAGVVVALFGR